MTWAITIVFLAAYYSAAIYFVRGVQLTTKNICICGAIIAMTVTLESIYITLPTGATICLCSPVPLMLLAVLVDKRLAFLSGWICGVIVLFLIPEWQLLNWAQFFVEHMVCLSCFGFAGVFGTDKRWKIMCGMLLSFAVMLTGHLLSGVLFFSQYAWKGWGAWGYSLVYNLSQNVPLCLLSGLIVLALPLGTLQKTLGKVCAA
jgi:Predicted membrane protein